jgi:hypothetical protein
MAPGEAGLVLSGRSLPLWLQSHRGVLPPADTMQVGKSIACGAGKVIVASWRKETRFIRSCDGSGLSR